MRKINEMFERLHAMIAEKPMTLFEIQKIENLNVNAAWYRINKLRKFFDDVKVVDYRLEFGRPAKVYGIGEKDVSYKSKEEILADQARQREHIFERFRLWDAATRHAVMCRA